MANAPFVLTACSLTTQLIKPPRSNSMGKLPCGGFLRGQILGIISEATQIARQEHNSYYI